MHGGRSVGSVAAAEACHEAVGPEDANDGIGSFSRWNRGRGVIAVVQQEPVAGAQPFGGRPRGKFRCFGLFRDVLDEVGGLDRLEEHGALALFVNQRGPVEVHQVVAVETSS